MVIEIQNNARKIENMIRQRMNKIDEETEKRKDNMKILSNYANKFPESDDIADNYSRQSYNAASINSLSSEFMFLGLLLAEIEEM